MKPTLIISANLRCAVHSQLLCFKCYAAITAFWVQKLINWLIDDWLVILKQDLVLQAGLKLVLCQAPYRDFYWPRLTYLVCMCICLYVWASCECWRIQKPEKGIESLGTGVPDRCEPPGMDAGTQTRVLWKSSPRSFCWASLSTPLMTHCHPQFLCSLVLWLSASMDLPITIFHKMKLYNVGTLVCVWV